MVAVLDINTALFGRCNPSVTFDHTLVPRLVGSVDIVHAIAKVGSEPTLTTQLSIQFMLAIWTRPTQDNLSLFLLHFPILPWEQRLGLKGLITAGGAAIISIHR